MFGFQKAILLLCPLVSVAFSAVAPSAASFEGKWDIVKISADGVRDPDPKYHPDIPQPPRVPDPYENMVEEAMDKPAEWYLEYAIRSPYATCLAKMCGRIVPAVCPDLRPSWWGNNEWWERFAKESKCSDRFQLLDRAPEAAYGGPDVGNKHHCVKRFEETLGDDPKNLKCKCAFNGWKINCPCDFQTVVPKESPTEGGLSSGMNLCPYFDHAELIPNSRISFKKPPHYWDDADSHNAFNPYRMTPEEREKFTSNLTTNGRCFPQQEPLHPLGVVDDVAVKFASIEACEQLRQYSTGGDNEISIPPLLDPNERLFNNTAWITGAYWNPKSNQQFAVGVRLTAGLNGSSPAEPAVMDFHTCRERVYSTAQCGFNPSDNSEPIGSGVSLFLDRGNIFMVEVESRELVDGEKIASPQRILPLRPQEDMGTVVTQIIPANYTLPKPIWESRPGSQGREGVWIKYVHAASSGVSATSSTTATAESSIPTRMVTSRLAFSLGLPRPTHKESSTGDSFSTDSNQATRTRSSFNTASADKTTAQSATGIQMSHGLGNEATVTYDAAPAWLTAKADLQD